MSKLTADYLNITYPLAIWTISKSGNLIKIRAIKKEPPQKAFSFETSPEVDMNPEKKRSLTDYIMKSPYGEWVGIE